VRLIFSWAVPQEPSADGEPTEADGVPADGDVAALADDAVPGAAVLAHPEMTSPHAAAVRTPKVATRKSRTT
jgi:hypothetical protein